MKILLHSNAPWAATGYGNQTRLFAPRIRDLGHEVTLSAFYGLEGAVINWEGMHVLPRGGDPYGGDVLPKHTELVGADIGITLIDAWVYHPENWPTNFRWVPWFPVDCEPLPAAVSRPVAQAFDRIVYSKFGLKQVQNAGLDAHYVPHGIDTSVMRPYPMQAAREAAKLPKDRYIVGIVGANKGYPSRKAWPEMMAAFAEFRKKHDDALLYLHTNPTQTNGGVNLFELAAMHGLEWERDILCADPYHMNVLGGLSDPQMATLYSALDVHLLASSGEGFGIPILEAQACGCPVIVGDWTSMSELCFSGWKIDKKDSYPFYIPIGAYQFFPRVGAIVDALDAAYEMRGNEDYRKRARDGALAYDADKVTEKYWKPVLQSIAEKIGAETPAASPTGHTHMWLGTGLYNNDGTLSVPCIECGAEMIVDRGICRSVKAGGFVNPTGLTFSEPDGVEWLILREIERDYDLDGMGLDETSKVIDIGAHVGIVSMYLAKTYGCKVEAFEPNPHNYKRLLANLKANGLEHLVTPHNLAVTGDGRDVVITEEVKFGNSGSMNIYGDSGVPVKSTTLTAIMGEGVDLLKIDCEGAEFEILSEPEMLRGKVKHIRGEFHGQHGDARKLVKDVFAVVPDVKVTLQGLKA